MTAVVLPAIATPMDPILSPEVVEDPAFIYQVKWDGVRMLAYLNQDQVILINKRGHIRTQQYPELQKLASLSKARAAIFDGELVVLKNGKPNFSSILTRDLSIRTSQIVNLVKEYPIHYMIFDLPFAGEDLRQLTLLERQLILQQIMPESEMIRIVENFDHGKSLMSAIKAQDMEGIVAKRCSSQYRAGKKHRDWFKIKNRRVQYCMVGGYSRRGKIINALLLGVWQGKDLLYVGKAGTGLKESDWLLLTKELSDMVIPISPFVNKPASPAYQFVTPQLVVRVEFAEWTETLTLRSPVITGFEKQASEKCRLGEIPV